MGTQDQGNWRERQDLAGFRTNSADSGQVAVRIGKLSVSVRYASEDSFGKLHVNREPLEQPRRNRTLIRIFGLSHIAPVCALVHSFGLRRKRVGHASRAAQLFADCLRAVQRAIVWRLPLALVSELVTVPTGKDNSTIENRHAAPAASCGTSKPHAAPVVIAWRPFNRNRILGALPCLLRSDRQKR